MGTVPIFPQNQSRIIRTVPICLRHERMLPDYGARDSGAETLDPRLHNPNPLNPDSGLP
jgi:hypothetical protein